MDEYRYKEMKRIMLNLAEWLNCPNEELENMMGISWMRFHDIIIGFKEEEE